MLQRLNARRTKRLAVTSAFAACIGACTATQYSVEDDSSPAANSHITRDSAAKNVDNSSDDDSVDPATDSSAEESGDGSPSTDLDADGVSDSGAVTDSGTPIVDSGVVPLTTLVTIPRPGGGASFSIEAREVSQKQYSVFLTAKAGDPSGQPAACAANGDYIPKQNWDPTNTPNRPVVGVDWCDAVAYCAWAGRHLCGGFGGTSLAQADAITASKSEWAATCTKGGAQNYPYGTTVDNTACVTSKTTPTPTRADDVATHAKCVGAYAGVYDIVGNASEWIDACDNTGSCAIMGSSWHAGDGTCGLYFAGNRMGTFDDLGFRCCKD